MRKHSGGESDPRFLVSVREVTKAGEPSMTKDAKDASGKWSDPTSSYDDAKAISRLVKALQDEKKQDQKDGDKTSS